MAHQVTAIEAMTDYDRNITLNVGTIAGGTHENLVPIECRACVYVMVATVDNEAEVRARLSGLTTVDPDVRLEVTPGLFRPPYAKSPEIQALYDKACGLAREIGFESIAAGPLVRSSYHADESAREAGLDLSAA